MSAPDGTPVEFFALLPGDATARLIHGAIPERATVLDLGCGAGRLSHPLVELGHEVTAVDQSAEMLANVRGATTQLADIETLDLGRTFDVVLLPSYLVNTRDDDQRKQFLATCERHLAPGGLLLIQRYDPEWAAALEPATSEADGFSFAVSDVTSDGDTFEATMTYGHDGRTWQQRFAGRVLDDVAMDHALAPFGLHVVEWLDEFKTWAKVTR